MQSSSVETSMPGHKWFFIFFFRRRRLFTLVSKGYVEVMVSYLRSIFTNTILILIFAPLSSSQTSSELGGAYMKTCVADCLITPQTSQTVGLRCLSFFLSCPHSSFPAPATAVLENDSRVTTSVCFPLALQVCGEVTGHG